MKILATLLLMSATLLPLPAAAQAAFSGPGEPVIIGRGFDVPSTLLGDVRRVNVMLPPGYEDEKSRGRRYPVLYLLDGGADWQDFMHIAGLVHQGSLWGGNEPMIVVGVESKDRRREFTTPSSDPKEKTDFPTNGGAEGFRRFLVDELRPQVDAAYRTNGVEGLIGESLAGYFVLDTALRHGADFDRYIVVSPSLWWDRQSLAKQAARLLSVSAQAPRAIWLAGADEGGAMQTGLDMVTAALKAHPNPRVTWTYTPYPEETHATVYHPAATRGIRALFPAPPTPTAPAPAPAPAG